MVARADILAGRAVILVNIQDTVDAQLRSIRNKVRAFSNGMNELGGDLFRGGIAGSLASVFPIKEFVNFQDQMLFLQTKAQATEKQMESLERVIRNLGMTTSFSSTEVAKGATMLAQAGFQPSAIESSLQAVLDLARGARIEMETSSTILSNILSAYKLDPNRAAEVASKLIATARLGTLDVVDIGESMKELMTTARQLNLPLEDTLGMIAQISNMSLRATKAGTSLNAAWANLSSKGEQLAELGITITDADLERPVQVFAKLSEALKRMPRQQQVTTLQNLFAIRGGRGFGAIIMQDLDDLEMKIRTIKTAGDEARISAQKLDSQLGGVGRRALSAFQELMLAVGATSEGPLTKFGNNLAKVFNDMSRLASANPQFVQGLLLIGPASLAAGVGLLTMTAVLGKMAMLITPIMMLNAAIFKTAAAIVGVNKRSVYGMYYAIARPYVTASKAIDQYRVAQEQATQAQAAYMLGPSEEGLKKARKTAKAAAEAAKNLPLGVGKSSPSINLFAAMSRGVGVLDSALSKASNNTFFDRLLLSPQPMAALLNMMPNLEGSFNRIADKTRAAGRSGISGNLTTTYLSPFIRGMNTLEKSMASRGFSLTVGNMVIDGFQRAAKPAADVVESIMTGSGKGASKGFTSKAPFVSSFQIIANEGLKIFGSLWKGLRAGIRSVASVNWLRVIITSFKGLGTALKGVLTVLNGIRRFVFSLSGALLIVEALIIFGNKIPGINQLLAGAGKALSALFSDLGRTLSNLNPSLSLLGRGIKDVFTGEAERGVERMKVAFSDIANIIRTGWTAAWANFMKNIEPAADRIKIIFQGVLGVIQTIIASIGSGLGTVFQSGGLIIKGDGTLLETIKSAFSTENIKEFFIGVIAFIGSIGQSLNAMLGELAKALNSVKLAFIAMLKSLTWIPKSGASAALASLDDNANQRRKLEDEMTALRSMFDADKPNQTSHALTEYQKQIQKAMQAVQDELDRLPAAFGTIAYSVEQGSKSIADAVEEAIKSVREAGSGTSSPGKAGGAARNAALIGWVNDMRDRVTTTLGPMQEQAQQEIIANLRSMGDLIPGGVKQFARDFAEGFMKRTAEGQEFARISAEVGKALVGDFQSTRGGMLQVVPRLEKLQEKANEHLEDVVTNTRNLLDKPGAVFS